jgi:hypothetical protein
MSIVKTYQDLPKEYFVCTKPVPEIEPEMGIFRYVHGSYATIEEAEIMVRKVREFYAGSSRVECVIEDEFPSGAKLYLDDRIPNDENNLLRKRHKVIK